LFILPEYDKIFRMRIKLLGSSAGGGFPQWNCSCTNCRSLRKGELKGKPRSQSQVALSADSKSWFLLNASPDLRSQIESNSELQPSTTLEQTRHTPISAVILTNADLDHVLGLLLMRESQPIHVYATKSVRKILTEDNSMYKMLDQKQGQVKWTDLSSETSFELTSHDGVRSGLICTPYSIDAKYPIYVGAERSKELSPTEAVLALIIEDTKTKKKMAYLPGIAALDETWLKRLGSCDLVFCDGTFWTDDEMRKLSGGTGRTSREMGHIPMAGAHGSIELLSKLGPKLKKVFTHINNTNPVLNESGPEFKQVCEAGLTLGHDGMVFDL
jgi:pyrroloquinoline quinone biosynthesis protein B